MILQTIIDNNVEVIKRVIGLPCLDQLFPFFVNIFCLCKQWRCYDGWNRLDELWQ